jgi:Transglycosylase SLT domain
MKVSTCGFYITTSADSFRAPVWLDCGVNTTSGWTPPPITLDNIIYEDLSEVMSQPNNPFEPCQPYLWMFQQLAGDTGIPTILLASIALQESGCQPNVTGGAGEIGMMQVTNDKCPPGNIAKCYDPYVSNSLLFKRRRSAAIYLAVV